MTTTIKTTTRTSERSRRRFARIWSWLDDSVDEAAAPVKNVVFSDLPSRIVEIGAGRGSNFKRYAPGTTVVAFEPNRYMHADLQATAAKYDIELDLRSDGVEDIDLDDQSVDAVVSSFTLCSVKDVDVALAQIHRILKPGGRFLFVEHITGEQGTGTARVQTMLRRPWAMLFDRCDLKATTHRAIERSRFTDIRSEIEGIGPKADPSRRTVFGTAIR